MGDLNPSQLPSVYQPTGRQGLHPLEGRSSRTAPLHLFSDHLHKLKGLLDQRHKTASVRQLAYHAKKSDTTDTRLRTIEVPSTPSGEQEQDQQCASRHEAKGPDAAKSTLQVAAIHRHEQRTSTKTPRRSSDEAQADQHSTHQAHQNGEAPPRTCREKQKDGPHVRLLVAFAAPFFWVGGPCSLQMLVALRRPLLHG